MYSKIFLIKKFTYKHIHEISITVAWTGVFY